MLAALACGVLGWSWLRTGTYRRPEDDGALPRHLWVPALAPFVGLVLERSLADRPWPALLAPLLLALVGLVLTAVDADVHRLPNALTVPLVPAVVCLLAVASATTDDWGALVRAALATVLVGGGSIALAFFLYGRSIGMGDAKLLVSIAPTLAWFGWSQLLGGIWLGFVLGGIVALALLLARRATRSTHLAFGPYLVAGAVLAIAFG